MQHNEKGTRRDLVLYRLEVAKSDIKSAKILLDAGECRRAITEPIMEFIMLFQLFML